MLFVVPARSIKKCNFLIMTKYNMMKFWNGKNYDNFISLVFVRLLLIENFVERLE